MATMSGGPLYCFCGELATYYELLLCDCGKRWKPFCELHIDEFCDNYNEYEVSPVCPDCGKDTEPVPGDEIEDAQGLQPGISLIYVAEPGQEFDIVQGLTPGAPQADWDGSITL